MPKFIPFLGLLLGIVPTLPAYPVLAPLFRDGAVLQRGQPLPVWGHASPGERIHVSFGLHEARTITSATGAWMVVLPAQAASSTPAELIVSGRSVVRITDILVGDLWLCAGQSNMEWLVERSANASREIAAGLHPLIRHFKVPHTAADTPRHDVPGEWESCSPETVGRFSAVAYFFARELQKATHVPIGLINCSWGGTPIEAWMRADALSASPAANRFHEQWSKRLAAHAAGMEKYRLALAEYRTAGEHATPALPEPKPHRLDLRWMPSGLYNAMISPFAPAALGGVIWYQGEANAPTHPDYAASFKEMIVDWRRMFGRELPFYFVQLANHNRASDKTLMTWAWLREAQASALAVPGTGMAVTIDIGEVDDVHPKDKQEVGRRLALIARARLLGEKIEYSGPSYDGFLIEGRAIRIKFVHADGLHTREDPVTAFEIAGRDGVFIPASARLEGQTVLVSADAVPDPVAVRYAWHNFPRASLFNASNLPATPFRTDTP